MRHLLQNLKKYRVWLAVALVSATVNQFFALLDPQLFRIVIDRYVSNFDVLGPTEFYHGISLWIVAAIGVAMISRIGKAFQDYYSNKTVQSVGTDLYNQGVEHSMKLPYTIFEDQRSGETLQQLQKAKTDSQELILNLISIAFTSLVTLVFVLIYAFFVHWLIGLTILVMFPLLGSFIAMLSRRIKSVQDKIFAQAADLAGSTTESLRNIELIKALGLEKQEIKRLNKTNNDILALELVKVKTLRMLNFMQGTALNLMRVTLLAIMFGLIFHRQITFGQFFSIMFYSFFIFQPLYELGTLIAKYQEARSSLENYSRIMAQKIVEQKQGAKKLRSIEEIKFESVTYGHENSRADALTDISFSVGKGQSIAFVGPSGAGKSTLVKLLIGLYRPQAGRIFYNGIELDNVDDETVRQRVGFVPQSIELFAGTIADNLRFVRPGATDEECREVLAQTQLEGMLSRARAGIDTLIGESGMKLSGGERQRLAIARALLRRPEILIFDEATSSLDSSTEAEITKTIKDITGQGRDLITILIAHRLSTISHVDKIVVLERGEIVEQGKHSELLKSKGLYYALWRQQSGEVIK